MLIEKIIDLVFPTKCSLCGKIGIIICKNCKKKLDELEINLLEKEIIDIDNEEKHNSKNIIIKKFYIYRYDGIIRDLLIKYKFDDASYLRELFAELILKNEKVCRFLKNYDIIIPVPISKKRRIERGYNQTELIVKFIERKLKEQTIHQKNKQEKDEKHLEIQVNVDILAKIKNIKSQSKSTLKERINNVKGVYKLVNEDKIKGKKIVIFDDIYTTGSTIKECVKNIAMSRVNDGTNKIKIGVLIIAKDYMEVI